jgi:hypothetical protein
MKGIISFTHLMEFLPGRVTGFSGKLLFADGMILVISPLILKFITKNTDILLCIPLVINILACLCFIFFYIPESTKYLLEKGLFDQAKKDIDYINRINKSSPEEIRNVELLFNRLVSKYKAPNSSTI